MAEEREKGERDSLIPLIPLSPPTRTPWEGD